MSAEAIRLPRAAVAESAPRPVYFKVTRRVDVSLLSWWQRALYSFLCRQLPEAWRVPPVPPMERGGFPTFAEADAACTSRDDQLRVLPWGWAYDGETLDSDIVCRPRDRSDEGRYLALREKYGDEEEYAARARLETRLERLTEQVRGAL